MMRTTSTVKTTSTTPNKAITWHIYLLKKPTDLDYCSPGPTMKHSGYIRDQATCDRRNIPFKDDQTKATIFVKQLQEERASWASLLPEQAIAGMNLHKSSPSAVVVFEYNATFFAITFGHGRYLINPEAIEEDFGIKTTLNLIDPSSLRAISSQRISQNPKKTAEQLLLPSAIEAFQIDTFSDVLNGVTGNLKTEYRSIGKKAEGKESLTFTSRTTFFDIPKLFSKLYEIYQKDDYKKDWPWVDHIKLCKDKTTRKCLDMYLIDELNKLKTQDNTSWLSLFPKEFTDFTNTMGFTYSKNVNAMIYDDLEINQLLEHFQGQELNIETLKQKNIFHIDSNFNTINHWSVYQCLLAEINDGGYAYHLIGGKWYKVEAKFRDMVDTEISRVPISKIHFPHFSKTIHKNEKLYNENFSKNHPELYFCLDTKKIPVGGNTIEHCDIISKNRHFIHVKPFHSSKSTSHLFNQAIVSAKTWKLDPEYRTRVNEKLPASFKLPDPKRPINSQDYEIVIAIIRSAKDLPFFSRITLANTYRELTLMNYKVSLAYIAIIDNNITDRIRRTKRKGVVINVDAKREKDGYRKRYNALLKKNRR